MTTMGVSYNMRKQITSFTENCTFHGLRIAGDSTAWLPRRILWGTAVTAFLCFVIMQGINLLELAQNPDIQTSVFTERHVVPIDLPALTICNKNVYRKSVTTRWDLLQDFEYQKVVSHQLKDMILECTEVLIGNSNCSNVFKQTWTDRGFCYTFNTDTAAPIRVDYSGVAGAWKFLLNAETHEYLFYPGTSESNGFQMLVHRQVELPSVANTGFAVSPGEETFIALTRTRTIRDIRMDCYNTSDPNFKNPLLYNNIYTNQICNLECYTIYVENQCDCRPNYFKGVRKPCSFNWEEWKCYLNATNNFVLDPSGSRSCKCPYECDTVEYQVRLSHSQYPSDAAMDYIQRQYNISKDQQRSNFARVVLYFETADVPTTKLTFAYDFSRLGGDLGGYMGLMLGASILSVLEFIDFIGLCIFTLFSSKDKVTHMEKS